MKKSIRAVYYFVDIGVISLLAISGFFIGVNKWIGVIGIVFITLLQVFTTTYLNNRNPRSQ